MLPVKSSVSFKSYLLVVQPPSALLFWPPVDTAVLLLFLAGCRGVLSNCSWEQTPSSPLAFAGQRRVSLPFIPSLSPCRHKPSRPDQRSRCGRHDLSQRLLGARLRWWIRADFLSLVRPSVSHPGMLCSLLLFLPSRPELRAAGGRRVVRAACPARCPVGITGLSSRAVLRRDGWWWDHVGPVFHLPSVLAGTSVFPSRFYSAYGARETFCIHVTLPLASNFKINCL